MQEDPQDEPIFILSGDSESSDYEMEVVQAPEVQVVKRKAKKSSKREAAPAVLYSRRCGCSYHLRLVKSRGAILVLILNTLVDISFYGALGKVFQLFLERVMVRPAGLRLFLEGFFATSLPFMFYPLAGWLADTRYGRFKVIRASLWMIWAGFLSVFITFLIKHLVSNERFDQVAFYGVFPVAFVIVNTGLAGFQANIIPFGLDQMPTGSAEEMSAFIHWYYFTRNIGAGIVLTILLCTSPSSVIVLTQSAVETFFLSVGLFILYCMKKWLVLEPRSRDNPFRTVRNVLKYAWQHKSPEYRSSLTYWEDELPSRIDLGKSKYGGPFTTETVENVKVFLRISLILICLGGFIFIYNTVSRSELKNSRCTITGVFILTLPLQSASLFFGHLHDPVINTNTNCTVGQLLLSELNSFPMIVSLPIYEFLIYPIFWKRIPTTLQRMGIGSIVGILSIIPLLIVDAYGHSLSYANNATVDMCFLVDTASLQDLKVDSYFLALPYTLGAIAEMLVFIGALEFISAQSPYNMHGMLIGAYYGIRGIFSIAADSVGLIFSLSFEQNPSFGPPSCGTLYFSLVIAMGTVGLIVYILVAKQYTRRQRDDSDTLMNQQMFVEHYYGSLRDS